MRPVESLAVESVPIDSVSPHPRNPRRGDVPRIMDSLRTHGQYRPIVVQRSTGRVLAGNHTREAARRLGWTDVAAVFVDVDDEQATRILLADNATADRGTYDDDTLSALLAELADTADRFGGTGFDTDTVDRLLASLDPDPLPELPDLSRFAERTCPFCQATWHEEGGEVVRHDD